MSRKCLVALLFLVLCQVAAATALAADAPLWLRYPAISPDGSTIVFAYRGDLYRVPAEGGEAVLLTVYGGYDFAPVFSHDGRWIAFSSDRHGNFDIFLMPIDGGEASRLTMHSAYDVPYSFTPDDKAVLFGSARLDHVDNAQFPTGAFPELYQVSVDGGRVQQILTTAAIRARYLDRDGMLIYQDQKSYEDPWRKHHVSSAASDLWIHDDDGHRRLTTFAGEDRDPVVVDGTLYYLSEESGSFNVHRTTLDDPGENQQLTRFDKHPVRFLTGALDGTLCFSFDGELYTMAPGGKPRKVAVEIQVDRRRRERELLPVSGEITEMALSPSGKELAFVVRGEVFVASVKEGTSRRITDTPEQERSVSWHPEGRSLLYAAERDGSWNLYRTSLSRESEKYFFRATLLEEEPVLISDAETYQPRYSPNGKEVAYLQDETTLRVLNLESGKSRTVLPGNLSYSYADGDQYYEWSPDSLWFLAEFLQPGVWSPEVGLVKADGSGEVQNLTESGFGDFAPRWMMGGKMMMWFSDRDGLRSAARTGARQADVYAQFFTQESWDRFRLSEEEFELLKEEEEEAEEDEDGDSDDGEEGDDEEDDDAEDAAATDDDGDDDKSDDKKEKGRKGDEKKKGDDEEEEEVEPLTLELEGLKHRKARLTLHPSWLSDAVVTPKGEKLLYLGRVERNYNLWSIDLRTRETKVLVKLGRSGGSLEMDEDGENLFLLSGGSLSKVEIGSGDRESIGLSGAEMWVDRQAEFAYFFEHAWRQIQRKFYDADLHGVDWKFYKKEYQRFLPHIDNGFDFAEMLSELLGELNASHTGASFRERYDGADGTASLGLFYDRSYEGKGLKVVEVMDKSPVRRKESKLVAGVIIEKIDGVAIEPEDNYHALMNRKAGRNMLLSLYDESTKERWEEVVKPISLAEERQLRYERWVEGRRRLTEELSDGRIGYVHVRSMSDSSYRTVYEEVMGLHATKDALVVDTRFNGGGDLVDDLSIFLSGEKYMEFIPPGSDRVVGVEPGARWTRPSIVVTNETNYSDAHCFPWAYKELRIGKVVGMPVAGTCTFVWWERLHDRQIVFGVPNMAVTDNEGRPLENWQLEPDILVDNEFGPVSEGRDQQIERAVEELLQEIGP
jgi:Tol biopolymer transport system component/C-terminal processing protease CtpA/Prc